MADDELLSQQEIDALLAQTDDDADTQGSAANARPYQLGREQGPAKGRLPTLEMIAERFARAYADSLREIFRCDFEIRPGGVETRSFSDYCHEVEPPVNLSVCSYAPLTGSGLLALDAGLIFHLVDHYFGGLGGTAPQRAGHFSPTEKRVVLRIRQQLFDDWDAAWEDVLRINTTVIEEESNPNLLNAFAANDLLTFVSFVVCFGDASGSLMLALPYKALEEHRALLDSLGQKDGAELAALWRPRLADALMDARVSLRCQIASTEILLKDVLNLQVGDVLQAEVPEQHEAFVDKVPLFRGKLGESSGKLALEFLSNG